MAARTRCWGCRSVNQNYFSSLRASLRHSSEIYNGSGWRKWKEWTPALHMGQVPTSRLTRARKTRCKIVCCLSNQILCQSQSHRPSDIFQAHVCYPHSRFPVYKGFYSVITNPLHYSNVSLFLQSFTKPNILLPIIASLSALTESEDTILPKRHVSIALVQ